MSWTLKDELSTELNLDPVPRESAWKSNPAALGRAASRTLASRGSLPGGHARPQHSLLSFPLSARLQGTAAAPQTALLSAPRIQPAFPSTKNKNNHDVFRYTLPCRTLYSFQGRGDSEYRSRAELNLSSAARYLATLGWFFGFSCLSFQTCRVEEQSCCGDTMSHRCAVFRA